MKQILLLMILATVFLAACTTPGLKLYGGDDNAEGAQETQAMIPTSSFDEFAACTAENDATLYGADWCPHCKDQKKDFGDSFAFVNYVECEENKATCQEANIRGYPTWIIKGEFLEGGRTLEEIAQRTGCELPA